MTVHGKHIPGKIEVTSKRFWLNSKDFVRGFLIAILSAGLYAGQVAFESGEFHPKRVLMAGAGGGIAYLIKNWLQPAQIKQDISNAERDAIASPGNSSAK
jgi:hypothetical protein